MVRTIIHSEWMGLITFGFREPLDTSRSSPSAPTFIIIIIIIITHLHALDIIKILIWCQKRIILYRFYMLIYFQAFDLAVTFTLLDSILKMKLVLK